MLTTRYIKDDLKIFMNRKCNNSFVILCVRQENEKDKTEMLTDWEQALSLVKEWTGLELTRDDFEEDHYVYNEIDLKQLEAMQAHSHRRDDSATLF